MVPAKVLLYFMIGARWATIYSSELDLFPEGPSVDIVASVIDDSPVIFHSASFDSAVVELAHSLARSTTAASSGDNNRSHFGTGQKGFGGADFELEIYALAQCLPSLSPEDCNRFLKTLFNTLLTANMTAGRAATVWCNFRFAPQHFFRGKPMLELPMNGEFIYDRQNILLGLLLTSYACRIFFLQGSGPDAQTLQENFGSYSRVGLVGSSRRASCSCDDQCHRDIILVHEDEETTTTEQQVFR